MSGSAFDQRPKTQYFNVMQGIDNLTWMKGPHMLKFGAEIRYWEPLFTDSSNYQGLWSFSGMNTQNPARTAGTGDAFADWMLGYPVSSARAHIPRDWFGGDATYWHFFAQDDYKVNNRLTLNLGLRYEYSPWMRGYKNQLGTFDGNLAKPIIVASNTNQIDLTFSIRCADNLRAVREPDSDQQPGRTCRSPSPIRIRTSGRRVLGLRGDPLASARCCAAAMEFSMKWKTRTAE